jgi:hypothetical protein
MVGLLRVRPCPGRHVVCIDEAQAVPAGHSHELLPSTAYQLGLELIAAATSVDSLSPASLDAIGGACVVVAALAGLPMVPEGGGDGTG